MLSVRRSTLDCHYMLSVQAPKLDCPLCNATYTLHTTSHYIVLLSCRQAFSLWRQSWRTPLDRSTRPLPSSGAFSKLSLKTSLFVARSSLWWRLLEVLVGVSPTSYNPHGWHIFPHRRASDSGVDSSMSSLGTSSDTTCIIRLWSSDDTPSRCRFFLLLPGFGPLISAPSEPLVSLGVGHYQASALWQ